MRIFSVSAMGLALAFLACTAATAAAAPAPEAEIDPATFIAALENLGPDAEFTVITLPEVGANAIIAADKVTLARLPITDGTPNAQSRAVFSWFATNDYIFWKLSLFNIEGFTGAHLHLNTPAGPIVQHLVPNRQTGDFIAPINIPASKVYTGFFGVSELQYTLGVRSIRQFIREFVSQNEIYINVHGPTQAAILKGFLNA